jgi:hypothetical protein
VVEFADLVQGLREASRIVLRRRWQRRLVRGISVGVIQAVSGLIVIIIVVVYTFMVFVPQLTSALTKSYRSPAPVSSPSH